MVRIFRKGHNWCVIDDTARREYLMPTMRLALDLAYELIGWPSQFSEGEVAPALVFGDPEVIAKRFAEDGRLFEVGEGYSRSEETWPDPNEGTVEKEAA